MTQSPLNIGFVTQDDPFYVRIFFERFLRDRDRRDTIKAVVIAPPMGKKTFAALVRQMFEFYGPVDFLRVGVRYVLLRIAARIPQRLLRGRSYSVEQLCRLHAVPVIHFDDVNAPEFLARLSSLDLDLVVSVAAPQVFREPLIRLPKMGCINIHNSFLPQYRGMLPNFWQLFHGEKSVGTTIHRINAGIDDGDILMQVRTPIHAGESLHELICRTKDLGAGMMIEMIRRFREGDVDAIPNSRQNATYFSFPTRKDVQEFRRRGHRLI